MRWITDGKVSVETGSDTVRGVGTEFSRARVYSEFSLDRKEWHQILEIGSDFQIVIDPPWQGADLSDQDYFIRPHTFAMEGEFVSQIDVLLSKLSETFAFTNIHKILTLNKGNASAFGEVLFMTDGVPTFRFGTLGDDTEFRIQRWNGSGWDDAFGTIAEQPTFLIVDGAAPVSGDLGEGQYGIKVNDGPWKLWRKENGVVVLKGTAVGINWRNAWDDATAYEVGDGVARLGKCYRALSANTGFAPEANPDKWEVIAAGGDRYDFVLWDAYRPASGEVLLRAVMTAAVTFQAGLGESRARVQAAPTADAVFALQKNGVDFGTLSFAAGATVGTYAAAAQTTFAIGDVFSVIAPNPRDETLSGLSATITSYR